MYHKNTSINLYNIKRNGRTLSLESETLQERGINGLRTELKRKLFSLKQEERGFIRQKRRRGQ